MLPSLEQFDHFMYEDLNGLDELQLSNISADKQSLRWNFKLSDGKSTNFDN